MRDSQFAEPLRHPSGATFFSENGQNPPVTLREPPFPPETGTLLSASQTFPLTGELPFKEGKAKVCTFGAIVTSSLRDTPSNRGNYLSGEARLR